MPEWVKSVVRGIDAMNYRIGRMSMYLLFVLSGVLLWSIIAKAMGHPPLWTQEMAQYTMVSYFVLGGAYSLQLGANVRMDLLYGRWSPRRQAAVDAVTVFAMIFFLGVVLYGGIDSTIYALDIGERSRTVWRPYLAPIKIIICFGTVLMILQSIVYLIRDIARLRGEEI